MMRIGTLGMLALIRFSMSVSFILHCNNLPFSKEMLRFETLTS